jgi:hypothetical protein
MTYTNNTFKGHYPVGSAAVMQADSQEEAARNLECLLSQAGLPQKIEPETMILLTEPGVILCDGNY